MAAIAGACTIGSFFIGFIIVEKTGRQPGKDFHFDVISKRFNKTAVKETINLLKPSSTRVTGFDERMYGVQEIIPILVEAGFKDISTANDITWDEPAQAGKHFAFCCRKPKE